MGALFMMGSSSVRRVCCGSEVWQSRRIAQRHRSRPGWLPRFEAMPDAGHLASSDRQPRAHSRWYGWFVDSDHARYSASASKGRTNACGNVRSDRRAVSSAVAFSSGSSPSGPPIRKATSRPSPRQNSSRSASARVVQRVPRSSRIDAAHALRQRGLEPPGLGLHQLRGRLAGARLGLDGLELEPHLGRKAALEFLVGRLCPGGWLLADGGDDEAHAGNVPTI